MSSHGHVLRPLPHFSTAAPTYTGSADDGSTTVVRRRHPLALGFRLRPSIIGIYLNGWELLLRLC